MQKTYLYENIYNLLIESIKSGEIKDGDKIPTEKELEKQFNVSRITVQKAITMLVEEGYLVRQSGVGTFVVNKDGESNECENKMIFNPKKKKSVGFILEALWSSYGTGLFDGAYDRADEKGYNLILRKSYGEQQKEDQAINDLIDMGVDGIILMPVHGEYYSENLLKLVVDKFPLVFIDRYLDGINVPIVSTDNLKASYNVVDHFIKRGHEHIGIVTSKDNEASTLDQRKLGYINALVDNNLDVKRDYIFNKLITYTNDNAASKAYEEYINSLDEYFIQNPDITAVFATEHHIASLVKIAAQRINKRVPEDLEIICFDQPKKSLGDYEFTFVEQKQNEMGMKALDVIIDIINNQEVERKILLDAEIIKGNSTK